MELWKLNAYSITTMSSFCKKDAYYARCPFVDSVEKIPSREIKNFVSYLSKFIYFMPFEV